MSLQYNGKYLVLCLQFLAQSSQDRWNFLRDKSVFWYPNKPLSTTKVYAEFTLIRWLWRAPRQLHNEDCSLKRPRHTYRIQTFDPTPCPPGKDKRLDRDCVQSPMANYVINCALYNETPWKPLNSRIQRASRLVNKHIKVLGVACSGRDGSSTPLPPTPALCIFSTGFFLSCILYNNPVIVRTIFSWVLWVALKC